MCPVCTVAVAGGLGLSRWLGIDDLISGFWIGALILSISFWFSRWLNKRYHLKQMQLPSIILMLILVFLPLNSFLDISRLLQGSAIGAVVFLLAIWLDRKIRQLKNKQLFNYQKIIIPFFCLSLASITAYFLIK